jgi:hypothetical protein
MLRRRQDTAAGEEYQQPTQAPNFCITCHTSGLTRLSVCTQMQGQNRLDPHALVTHSTRAHARTWPTPMALCSERYLLCVHACLQVHARVVGHLLLLVQGQGLNLQLA